MIDEVTIEVPDASDLPLIVKVWEEFMDYHADLDNYFTRSVDASRNFHQFLNSLLTDEKALLIVAKTNNTIVGYSIAKLAELPPVFELKRYVHLYDMAVSMPYRRMGIGSMMMENIEQWAAENGVYHIQLQVSVMNKAGCSFWKKKGFTEYLLQMRKTVEEE